MKIKTENFEQVQVNSVDELHLWLEKNHSQKDSVWIVTYKKIVPDKYISMNQLLDELVAFGWIDGIRRQVDEEKTMQLISPRQTQYWAKTYKDRASKLIFENRMQVSGMAKIKESKKNGLWDFMNDVDNLIIPLDLKKLLEENNVLDFFEKISDSNKRNILRWIKIAKTEKTRKARIAEVVNLAKLGKIPKPNG